MNGETIIKTNRLNKSECSPKTDVTSLLKVHELIQGITQDNQVESVICTIMFKSIAHLSQKNKILFFTSFNMYLYLYYIFTK